MNEDTYPVPWKLMRSDNPPVSAGLVVYWFPSSGQEFQKSSMQAVRDSEGREIVECLLLDWERRADDGVYPHGFVPTWARSANC